MAGVETTPPSFEVYGVPLPTKADLSSPLGQRNPRSIGAVPSSDTIRPGMMQLGTAGPQTANTVIEVTTRRGGNVGTGAGTWTLDTSPALSSRGLDTPATIQAVDLSQWTTSSPGNSRNLTAVTLPDDSVVEVYAWQSAPANPWELRRRIWDPDTETWGAASTVWTGTSILFEPHPALCLVEDGRLLLFWWNCDDVNFLGQIDVMASRDSGSTWATYAQGILGDPWPGGLPLAGGGGLAATPGRIAVCIAQQQLSMFIEMETGTQYSGDDAAYTFQYIFQFASGDYGASITFLGYGGDAGRPALVNVQGVLWFAYVNLYFGGGPPGENRIYFTQIAAWSNIFYPPGIAGLVTPVGTYTGEYAGVCNWVPVTSLTITSCDFGMYAEDRHIYIPYMFVDTNAYKGYAVQINTTNDVVVVLPQWGWDGLATSTEIYTDFCAIGYRRAGWVLGRMLSATSTFEDQNVVAKLGGYTSVTMPIPVGYTGDVYRTAWDNNYIPTALPSVYGWTHTGAGTESISTTAGWLTLANVAVTSYESITISSGAADGDLWLFRMRRVAGGSVSSTTIGITARHAGVGYGYKAAVQISGTQIRVTDVYGANATLGTITLTAGTWEIRLAITSGLVTVHARLVTQSWDRCWTVIVNAGVLTDDGGGGGTTNLLQFGNITAGTATSEWQIVNGTIGALAEADGFTNPTDLRPFDYTSTATFLAADVRMTATGGVAAPGDVYYAYPDAEYALRYAGPYGDPTTLPYIQSGQRMGPSSPWKSLDLSGISFPSYARWYFPDSLNQALPPIVVLQFVRLNTPSVVVRLVKEAGPPITVGTHSLIQNSTGLLFDRYASKIVCDTGGASTTSPYVNPGEWIGGWVVDGSGNVAPIVDNTGGKWGNGGDCETPIITLGGDYAAMDSTGSMDVIPPVTTFIYYNTTSATASGFDLYWAAKPATELGYIEAGMVVFCEGRVPFLPSDWGTTRQYAEQAELLTSEWGVDFTRKAHTERQTRLLQFAYLDYDGRLVQTGSTLGSRVWFRATSTVDAPRVATSGDTMGKILGLLKSTQGAQIPIVHVGQAARGTPNTQSLTLGLDVGLCGLMTAGPTFTDDKIYSATGQPLQRAVLCTPLTIREVK